MYLLPLLLLFMPYILIFHIISILFPEAFFLNVILWRYFLGNKFLALLNLRIVLISFIFMRFLECFQFYRIYVIFLAPKKFLCHFSTIFSNEKSANILIVVFLQATFFFFAFKSYSLTCIFSSLLMMCLSTNIWIYLPSLVPSECFELYVCHKNSDVFSYNFIKCLFFQPHNLSFFTFLESWESNGRLSCHTIGFCSLVQFF